MEKVLSAIGELSCIIEHTETQLARWIKNSLQEGAEEGYAASGRGVVYTDLTSLVVDYIEKKVSPLSLAFYYVSEEKTSEALDLSPTNTMYWMAKAVKSFNPKTEYVVFFRIFFKEMPPELVGDNVPDGTLIERFCVFPKSNITVPNLITEKQIRKRLKRMLSQGKEASLVIDMSHPDFMGENCKNWYKVVKELYRDGKKISLFVTDVDGISPEKIKINLSLDLENLAIPRR